MGTRKILWDGEEIEIPKNSVLVLYAPERIEAFQNVDPDEKFVDGIPHNIMCANIGIILATRKKGFEAAMKIINDLQKEENEDV